MEGRPSQKPKTTHVGDNNPSVTNPDSLDGALSFEQGSPSYTTTAWTSRTRPCLQADIISLIAAFIPGMFITWGYEPYDTDYIKYAKAVLAFSQISRLFREVALHTQTLWSKIMVNTYGEGKRIAFPWELFIARSRMAPLSVLWYAYDTEIDYGAIDFALLFNSTGRWKELYLMTRSSFFKFLSSFKASDDTPSLPALEAFWAPDLKICSIHDDVPFLAPSLRHLSTNNPTVFEIWAPTLVSFATDLYVGYYNDPQDIFDRFKAFLGICPLLESLWIEADDESSDVLDGLDHKYIDLPSVKTLRVDFCDANSPRLLGIFLQSMHMVNLETLELRDFEGDDASFADMFRNLEFASHVRSLTLHAEVTAKGAYKPVPFRSIDEKFCSVSSLTVSRWTCTDQIRGCHFPHLRRLVVEWPLRGRLTGGPMPSVADAKTTVEDVLEFLQNRSNSDGEEDYEPFHLILCGYGLAADDDEVKRIVWEAGDKLVFEAHPSAEPFYSFVPPYAYR